MTIAETLATRIAAVSYDSLPDEARHWAKVAIMDTVGCILAGAHEPCARIAGQVAALGGASGPCVVFGTEHRVGPMDAAAINGTASHALDYDDCSDTLGGHPSAPILPGLFALAETRGANGREFIAAYIAGWETETRIARGVNFHHYEKGWHPTATLGVFGAAAACARLLELPVEKTARVGSGSDVFVWVEGELRNDDETAACRSGGAQRVIRGVAGVGGFYLVHRCDRAPARVFAGVQRRGKFCY